MNTLFTGPFTVLYVKFVCLLSDIALFFNLSKPGHALSQHAYGIACEQEVQDHYADPHDESHADYSFDADGNLVCDTCGETWSADEELAVKQNPLIFIIGAVVVLANVIFAIMLIFVLPM